MAEKDIFDEMLGTNSKGKKAKPAPAEEKQAEEEETAQLEPEAKEEVEETETLEEEAGEEESEGEEAEEAGGEESEIEVPAEAEEAEAAEEESEVEEAGLEEADEVAEKETAEQGIEEEGLEEEEIDEESLDEAISDEFDDEDLDRESLKKEILEKAAVESQKVKTKLPCGVPLNFLEDEKEKKAFIGRSKSVFQKYGLEAALHIGRVGESEHFNQDVLFDSLNPHVVFVCGARGSGKCLHGDTLITLDNGLTVPIKDLEGNANKVLGLNHQLKVEAIQKTEFFKRKVNKLLYLKLRTGKDVKLTPEHPLLTINGWVAAKELTLGDRIATPRVINAFGSKKMREGDVKLLAYFIAEGHLNNAFVLFSNSDDRIVADFKTSVFEFDENLRIERHSHDGCYRVTQKKKKVDISSIKRNEKGRFTSGSKIKVEKSSLMQWLESLGLYGKLAKEKFIPKEIFALEKSQLSLFLNRLFSCDGCIRPIAYNSQSWEVSYCSSSKTLIYQVQDLLLRFGIISRIKAKKVKCNGKIFDSFELFICGENAIKFNNEIGFIGDKEAKQAQALENMLSLKRNPNLDTVPKEIWQSFKPDNWTHLGRQVGYARAKSFRNRRRCAPSREMLLKTAQIEENKGIQLLAESDIFWDEIIEVKELVGEFEVYDISVPVYHNFVANNIIVHNSYVLGVIAEELALKNKNVGIMVIDPIGVFWSMKFPNKEEREVKILGEWGLEPCGLSNLKVFVPKGISGNIPSTTYDATFAVQPSLLTGEDWCLTFGIERFSPTGLLLEKALRKVGKGYKTDKGVKVAGKGKNYSLDELIKCLETDAELNSRDKGFKPDSVRALVSRFDAAKSWGIFDVKGTPLSELSRENQLSIIDTSFLDDAVTALVVGLFARRLLAARKISTRKEAAQKIKSLNVDELMEMDVPPTWLFIDEAHTLIPSGNVKTPATHALVEYVKQGRRPGCSLVFATQQPSAIDSRVLSQLDLIMTHKLVFDDDVKAVFKRTPTIIPAKYKKSTFIKTLPVGVAVTGDRREETSRAFILKIRPRFSQHEGRDAVTIQSSVELTEEQAMRIISGLAAKKVEREEKTGRKELEQWISSLNSKYSSKIKAKDVFDKLEKEGFEVGKDFVALKKAEEVPAPMTGDEEEGETVSRQPTAGEEPLEPTEEGLLEETELLAFPVRVSEGEARKLADKFRQKKVLGFFGKEELLENLQLKYRLLWKVQLDVFVKKNEFIARDCFIDSITGEFVHFDKGTFLESKGLPRVMELKPEEIKVLRNLKRKKQTLKTIALPTELEEKKVERILEKFAAKGFAKQSLNDRKEIEYCLRADIDLPVSPKNELIESLKNLPFVQATALAREREAYSKEQVLKALHLLWPNILVRKTAEVYWPLWHAQFNLEGKRKLAILDGFTGQRIR